MRILTRVLVDLREAWRGLKGGRGTSLLAFTLLSVTMAAATVTFSVVDGIALRPLPYGNPDRLVGMSFQSVFNRPSLVHPAGYFEWVDATRAFAGIGASRFVPPLTLNRDGSLEELSARKVTVNLFDVLQVRAMLGRSFGPEHGRSGGPAVVMLSHDAWLRHFGGDRSVVGRRVRFDDTVRDVIGVLPADVTFPITAGKPPDVYVPYVVTEADRGNDRALVMSVVGRLRDGISLEQARADVVRVATREVVVMPLHDQVVGPARTWLLLVLAAIAAVLLVACANVASLLIARAAMRSRDIATREALGASRARLAAGLLLEGLTLALASAAAGVVLSYWGLRGMIALLPAGLTRVSAIAIDGRVLLVCAGAALACGLLFSSAPAWLTRRTDLVSTLKGTGGGVLSDRLRARWLSGFLVANVAFVCMLLVASTLVVASFVRVTTADLGFDRHNIVRLSPLSTDLRQEFAAVGPSVHDALLARIRAVPGVVAAAIAENGTSPMSGSSVRYSLEIPGAPPMAQEDWLETNMVSPDYFRVMGMRVVRGRVFDETARAGTPGVMVINEVAARRFFHGRDPIGQIVTFRGPTTIIGVIGGVNYDGPEAQQRPAMYVPIAQQPKARLGTLFVRTQADPRPMQDALTAAVREQTGRDSDVRYVDDDFRKTTEVRRFNALVMIIFGVIAVLIGALGVYGAMAFFVARQVRTIGLRMALGASPARVRRSVLRDALVRVAAGSVAGLVGAWVASGALRSLVFGLSPTEPIVYLATALFIAVIGVAAALIPARRAARLDPLTALRHD